MTAVDAWAAAPPPPPERVTALGGTHAALDAALRADPRGALPELMALLEGDAEACNVAHCWGLRWMPVAAGDRAERVPPSWLDPPGPGLIARVERPGVLTADGLLLRAARVVRAEEDLASVEPVGGPTLLDRLAGWFNATRSAPDATRELKRALEAGEPADQHGWLARLDALGHWRAAAEAVPAPLAALVEAELTVAIDVVGEVYPMPGETLAALRAQWGEEGVRVRERWADAPPGSIVAVERYGLPGQRPARVWVSRGPAPRAIQAIREASRALPGEARAHVAQLIDGPVDRALIGAVNALDAAGHPDVEDLLAHLREHGVAEERIAVGEAFDRYPPELYQLRRVPSAGARSGEIVAVRRRAFRGPDGQVVQQATIEVNLA